MEHLGWESQGLEVYCFHLFFWHFTRKGGLSTHANRFSGAFFLGANKTGFCKYFFVE